MVDPGARPIVVLTNFFSPAVKAGGPVQSLAALAESEMGHRVRVLAGDRDLGDTEPMEQITRGVWSVYGRAEVMYLDARSPLTLFRAWRTTLALRPSHVYLNSLFSVTTGLLPLLMGRFRLLGKACVVIAPRGQLDPGALRLSATRKQVVLHAVRLLGLARGVRWHATSELEAGHIRRIAGPEAKIFLALPVPRLPPRPLERSRPSTPLQLLYLSRISPKKGLHTLIRSLAHVEAPTCLDVYGPVDDAGYAQECLSLASRLPSRHRIEFHGAVPHEQVSGLMQVADVFVLPTHGENFGHAIFEAVSAGCPLILTPTTPWTDVVRSGAGWVVDTDDIRGLGAALSAAAATTCNEFRDMSKVALDAGRTYHRRAQEQDGWPGLFDIVG